MHVFLDYSETGADFINLLVGLDGSLKMQGTQTHMTTRLRDFIIMNVDPKTIHKKAS